MTTSLIEPGLHRGVIRASDEGLRFGITGEGVDAKEQVVVLFDLVDPTDPDVNRSITWFGFLNDKNFDRTIEALRYCGWDGDELAELPQLAATGGLAVEVDLVVNHEEYNGVVSAKVRWVNRVGGGGVKLKQPLEGAELAAFSARMRGRVRVAGTAPRAPSQPRAPQARVPAHSSGNGGGGSRPQQPHPHAPGGAVDEAIGLDDIPF